MAFARQYSLEEVKFMLQFFEGNKMHLGFKADGSVERYGKAAHPALHGGASRLDQQSRVRTPGEPRMTGTYWTADAQAEATRHVINSFNGQIALRKIDIGETIAVNMKSSLPPRAYKVAQASDDSNKPGQAGHLVKNAAGRAGASTSHAAGYATEGFVRVVKGVGGKLQVQTAFPSGVDLS